MVRSNGCKLPWKIPGEKIDLVYFYFRGIAEHRYTWLQSTDCYFARRDGLTLEQFRFCREYLDLMPHIHAAAKEVLTVCMSVFSQHRWNCSSLLFAPYFLPELRLGRITNDSIRLNCVFRNCRTRIRSSIDFSIVDASIFSDLCIESKYALLMWLRKGDNQSKEEDILSSISISTGIFSGILRDFYSRDMGVVIIWLLV